MILLIAVRYQKLEEERFRRDQQYKAIQRREERQHELTMMQMLLAGNQNTNSNAFQCSNYSMVPGPSSEHMHYLSTSSYTNRSDDSDYFQL